MRRLLLAGTLAAGLTLSACSGDPHVETPDLAPGQQRACARFLDALPARLADLARVPVDPPDAPAAAYGDPAITLICGVPRPAGYDAFSECLVADGVGWYVPADSATDEPSPVRITAAGYRPRVEVRVPARYWPTGMAAVIAELAATVRRTLELVQPCR